MAARPGTGNARQARSQGPFTNGLAGTVPQGHRKAAWTGREKQCAASCFSIFPLSDAVNGGYLYPSVWAGPDASVQPSLGRKDMEARLSAEENKVPLSEDTPGVAKLSWPPLQGMSLLIKKNGDMLCHLCVCHKAGLHSPPPKPARIYFPQKRKSSLNPGRKY